MGRDQEVWVAVCQSHELAPGESLVVKPDKKLDPIALFRHVDGKVYAIRDRCGHGAGRLSVGDIEELGECAMGSHADGSKQGGLCVRCPKHRAKFAGGLYFNLEDGHSFTTGFSAEYSADFRVPAYRLKEDEGLVYLDKGSGGRAKSRASIALAKAKWKAGNMLKKVMGTTGDLSLTMNGSPRTNATPNQWETWKLQKLRRATPNTYIFWLERDLRKMRPFPTSPIWHVSLRVPTANKKDFIVRDYTPISSCTEWSQGRLVLLIKLYQDGTMSQYLKQYFTQVGSKILVGPPHATLEPPLLALPGCAACAPAPPGPAPQRLHLGLVGGGTGLTPMVQILTLAVNKPWKLGLTHALTATLIYCVQTELDVCMCDELSALAGNHEVAARAGGSVSVSVSVVVALSRSQPDMLLTAAPRLKLVNGRVSNAMLREHLLPAAGVGTDGETQTRAQFVLCGPQGLMDASRALLVGAGHTDDQIVELST